MEMAFKEFRQQTTALRRFFEFYRFTFSHMRDLRKNLDAQGKPTDRELVARLKKIWAGQIFDLMNVRVNVSGRGHLDSTKAHLFLGNHISYLDIPLLFSIEPVTFVAKEELAAWPVIGTCIKSADILLVKRESAGSRRRIAKAVANAVLKDKQSVCIFPSGTTTINEEKPWRWGAFKIAREHKVPVQPFRLRYTPLREAAYIDDDTFLFHFLNLLRENEITADIEFGEPFLVENVERDLQRVHAWSQEFLL